MSIYAKLTELERQGEAFAIATVIRAHGSVPRHDGSKMVVFGDGRIEGTIGGGDMESRVIRESLAAIADGKTRVLSYAFRDIQKGDVGVCGGEVEVYVEPVKPRSKIVIVGGGHVGKAVAHLAGWLGFRVVVSDDRPEFARPEAVPDADEHIECKLSELPERTSIDGDTYVLLTTRGVPVDLEGLPGLLSTSAAYIGVIGSRRRWEVCVEQLRAAGVSDEDVARVVSPMGLELNAETPEEIAVSILAEIVMLRRAGTGERMRHATNTSDK